MYIKFYIIKIRMKKYEKNIRWHRQRDKKLRKWMYVKEHLNSVKYTFPENTFKVTVKEWGRRKEYFVSTRYIF